MVTWSLLTSCQSEWTNIVLSLFLENKVGLQFLYSPFKHLLLEKITVSTKVTALLLMVSIPHAEIFAVVSVCCK